MRHGILASCLLAAAAAFPGPARACGFVEAPIACGETDAEREAKWMLNRVVAAVERDEAQALRQFTRGEGGFRTADTYVFCIGPDGVMSAHPSAALQGRDVRELRDDTGNSFVRTMMESAKPGQFSQIRSLFPRPAGDQASARTTFYTRAGDQICGVGVYEDGETRPATQPAATPDERVAQLRRRLDGRMPPEVRADWTAFLEALDEEGSAQDEVLAKARESVQAAGAVLATNTRPAAASVLSGAIGH